MADVTWWYALYNNKGESMKYIKVCDEDYEKINEQFDVSVVDHNLAENIQWLESKINNYGEVGKKMAWKEYFGEYKEELLKCLSKEEIKEMGEDYIDFWVVKLCIWLEGVVCESFNFSLGWEDEDFEDMGLSLIGEPYDVSFSYSPSYGTN